MEGKKLFVIPAVFMLLIVFSVLFVPQASAASTVAPTSVKPALTYPDPVCQPADLQLTYRSGRTGCYLGFGFVDMSDLAFALYAGNYNGYASGGLFGTIYFCKGQVITSGALNGGYISRVYMSSGAVSWC